MKNQQLYIIIGSTILAIAVLFALISTATAPHINAEEAITPTPSPQTGAQTFNTSMVVAVATNQPTVVFNPIQTCQRLATPELTIRSYSQLGDAYYLQNNTEQMLFAYNCLLQINPNDPLAYARRGFAYASMGRYEQAMQDYDASIHLNPAQEEVYNNRGILHTAYGRIGEAMLDFELAIVFNPAQPRSYFHRGTIHAIQADYDAALIDFNYALQLDPHFTRAHMAVGTIHMMIALDNYTTYQQLTGAPVNQPGGSAEQLFVSLRDNNPLTPPVSTWYALQIQEG